MCETAVRVVSLSLECHPSLTLSRKRYRPCQLHLPKKTEQRGTDTQESEREMQTLTAEGTQVTLSGTERKERVESEAGTEEIKSEERQLPPGWEWVWMEDPWTRAWEKLRIPKRGGRLQEKERDSPETIILGRS